MKFVKKPLSVVLALLMVLTTISVFASTFDDGYMRTIEYQVRYFDELGYETTKVYPGQ